MKRLIISLYLIFSVLFCLFAEESKEDIMYRDSVMRRVQQMPHDSTRLYLLDEIAYLHQYPPHNKFFATALYEEGKLQQNLYYENQGAYYIASYYDKKHDPDSLSYWVEELKEFAQEMGTYDYYLEQKAAVSRALASKRMIEKAVYVAKETLDEATKWKSNNGKIAAYNSLGCAYGVSSRSERALDIFLKAYQIFEPETKEYLKVDVLSRIAQVYGNSGKDSLRMPYLAEMKKTLQEVLEREPDTQKNWANLIIDCEVKYVLHYMVNKDYERAMAHIEKAESLLGPHVDAVFWLNIQLIRLQYFSRTKEYDKSIALIDKVTPIVLKNNVNTFGVLMNYKATTQWGKGDSIGAIETRKYLIRTQDSLNNAFSSNQLDQIKDIYHIDELLLEKQKVTNINYVRIFVILLILSILALIFYIYTRYLSRKIVQAEREVAEAAAHSEEDNMAKERLKMEISHDIRTPLNAVVGFAELLAETDDLDKETKLVYGKIIQENAEQLLDYVNNILELSRLESGKIKYEEEEVEIIGLCREIVRFANGTEDGNERISIQTSVDRQLICTDKKWFVSLLRSLFTTPSGDHQDFDHITLSIEREDVSSVLIFIVTGTLLARENNTDKKLLIRNEINSHFIRYFNGTYTVTKDKDKPTVIFTCPLLSI